MTMHRMPVTSDTLAGELLDIIREQTRIQDRLTGLLASVMAMPSAEPIRVQTFLEEAELKDAVLDFHVMESPYERTAEYCRTTEDTVRRIVERARAAGDPRATFNPDTPAPFPQATSHTLGTQGSDSEGGERAEAPTGNTGSDQESAGEEQDRNEPISSEPALAGRAGEGEAVGATPSPASREPLPRYVRRKSLRSGRMMYEAEITVRGKKFFLARCKTVEEAAELVEVGLQRMANGRHPKTNQPLLGVTPPQPAKGKRPLLDPHAPVGTFSDIKQEQGRLEATFTPASEEVREALITQRFTAFNDGEKLVPVEEPAPAEEPLPVDPKANGLMFTPAEISAMDDDEVLERLDSGDIDAVQLMEAEAAAAQPKTAAPTGFEATVIPVEKPKISPGKVVFVDREAGQIEGPKGRVAIERRLLPVFRHMSDGRLYSIDDMARITAMKTTELQIRLKAVVPKLQQIGVHLNDGMKTLIRLQQA